MNSKLPRNRSFARNRLVIALLILASLAVSAKDLISGILDGLHFVTDEAMYPVSQLAALSLILVMLFIGFSVYFALIAVIEALQALISPEVWKPLIAFAIALFLFVAAAETLQAAWWEGNLVVGVIAVIAAWHFCKWGIGLIGMAIEESTEKPARAPLPSAPLLEIIERQQEAERRQKQEEELRVRLARQAANPPKKNLTAREIRKQRIKDGDFPMPARMLL